MTSASISLRHDRVNFHFLGAEEDTDLLGSVLIREGEMVLDIPEGYGPYLIVGKPNKHWFEGTNSAYGIHQEVDAKWADIGGTFVGIWIENGYEFLFSFNLSTKPD